METILNFLSAHYPTIGILLVAGFLLYKGTLYHVSLQNTKKKVDGLPCDTHTQKTSDIELKVAALPCEAHTQKLNSHATTLGVLNFKIDTLSRSLELLARTKDKFSKRSSPWELTELGVELAKTNNFYEMIDRNWEKISSAVAALNTRNPFDIQQYSIDAAFADTMMKPPKFFTEDEIDKLKILAYTTDADLLSTTRVLGIIIRDRYFSENDIIVEQPTKK